MTDTTYQALNSKELLQVLCLSTEATAVYTSEDIVIEMANDAMIAFFGKGKSVIGKKMEDAIPELKGQPFITILKQVWQTGVNYEAKEAEARLTVNGSLKTFYFNFIYKAIKKEDGSTYCILHNATDVTEAVKSKRLNEQLRTAVEAAKIGTWSICPDKKQLEYNPAIPRIFGYEGNEPLKYDQFFVQISEEYREKTVADINKAITTKGNYDTIYSQRRFNDGGLIWLRSIGKISTDENGDLTVLSGVLIDITKEIKSRNMERALNGELAATNEILNFTNEALATTNEELMASNEEISDAQLTLQRLNDNLVRSENRFRNLVRQAPVSICVIRSADLMIIEVNNAYLELVGKSRKQMENQIIWQAIPEAVEVYAPIMEQVILTGIPFVANEHEVQLIRKGKAEQVFINFVYEPVKELNGKVSSVMVVGTDVTGQVLNRRLVEEAEERSRLAIEAAGTGTFDLNLITDVLLTSQRFNNIFGFNKHMSRKKLLSVIHPDDKEERLLAHRNSLKTGSLNYETRVIHPDKSEYWVRVQGKVYYNNADKPLRILGVVLDVTEFKRLQQQKDDFISIASHELKTPVTSLKASLQLLNRMKANPPAGMMLRLIEQSDKSIQKISILIDDLLNVSRMNEGQLKLNKSTFSVSEMLNNCCQHVRSTGKHELIVQGLTDLEIYADEQRIDQVVINFVNNAVKYAYQSDKIYLIIQKEGNMAKISVKDDGPGIEAEKHPHLFDRYYRADHTNYNSSGLGLGLYISAEIIHKHGGQIGVNSEPGQGSTFWFALPLTV